MKRKAQIDFRRVKKGGDKVSCEVVKRKAQIDFRRVKKGGDKVSCEVVKFEY
jgi:hypothetical protein